MSRRRCACPASPHGQPRRSSSIGRSGDTDVRVIEGTVEVEDADRRGTVRVRGGQRTQVVARSAPSEPRSYDGRSDSDEWKRFFEKIGRAIDDAFKQLKGAFR